MVHKSGDLKPARHYIAQALQPSPGDAPIIVIGWTRKAITALGQKPNRLRRRTTGPQFVRPIEFHEDSPQSSKPNEAFGALQHGMLVSLDVELEQVDMRNTVFTTKFVETNCLYAFRT